MIELQPVQGSSAVESMGYDPTSQTLAVRYKNAKSTTHFIGVEPHVNEQLHAADSIGSFLHSQIRSQVGEVYKAETIPDDEDAA